MFFIHVTASIYIQLADISRVHSIRPDAEFYMQILSARPTDLYKKRNKRQSPVQSFAEREHMTLNFSLMSKK